MVLVGYYIISIDGFSKDSHPIISFQKSGMIFEWTTNCERSFQHLKSLLKSAPILRIVDPNEYFVVFPNTCKESLGGVLSHNGHVVCCESRNLEDHERHHPTHDL
jgi:hypothetical protein